MSLYYNATSKEIKELPDSLIEAWADANNPKLAYWALMPPKPEENARWSGAEWVVPTEPVPLSVSARQIRLWLVRNGFQLAQVEQAINSIENLTEREVVKIEWEYAPYIERSHIWLVPLAQSLGLTEEQIDQAFREAALI
jgi:hypothetical protein